MGSILYDLEEERQGRRSHSGGSSYHTDSASVGNTLSQLGTAFSRTAHNRIERAPRLNRQQLAELGRDGLARTIVWELPRDAATPVKVVTDAIEPQRINDALDVLRASKKFTEATGKARWFGGAACFLDLDDGEPLDQPVNMDALQSIRQIHVLSRHELIPLYPLDRDLSSSNLGLPVRYSYSPTNGERVITDETTRSTLPSIHHSRLIRFYGEAVAEEQLPEVDYWGQSVLETVWQRLANLTIAEEAGAELTHQVGQGVLYLENLAAMLAKNGEEEVQGWIKRQMLALSSLNALVLGPSDKFERINLQLTGWSEIFDRLLLPLCAVTRMPIVKLIGIAPGGLTSDDQSSARQWGKRVDAFQDDELRPAYDRLLQLLFASARGPTEGAVPASWRIEFEPYEVPSESERASTTDKRADTMGKLLTQKVISVEEARASLDGERGLVLLAEEDEKREASAAAAAAPAVGTKVGAESVADTALNGAQSAAAAAIVTQVEAGEMSVRSGMEILKLAFLIPEDRAAALLNVAPAAAPAPGVETTPTTADNPTPSPAEAP